MRPGFADKPTVRKSSWRVVWNIAAIVLAVVLVVQLARAADWRTVIGQVRHARLSVLLAWVVLGSAVCFLRALRWWVLLSGEKRVTFSDAFWANSSGNLGNNVLPARAGEFIRATMVSVTSGLSKRFVLAVGLCERVLDMLILVVLARAGLSYVSSVPYQVQRVIHLAFWVALCTLAALILATATQRLADLAAHNCSGGASQLRRIGSHLQPFVEGIRTIHNRNRLLLFFFLTIPIWLIDAWGAQIVAGALGFRLPLPVVLILLAALASSSLLPTTPGQLGVFQFVNVKLLAIAGIHYNQALTYSLVLQAATYVLLAGWGIPGLVIYRRARACDKASSVPGPATVSVQHVPG